MTLSLKALQIYFVSFFSLVLLFGCQGIAPSHEKGDLNIAAGSVKSYQAAFDLWTREGSIYVGLLDVKLISSATYLTPEFRQAFAAEYADRYRLTEPEKDKFSKDQENAAAAYEDFIFAAYVPEEEWDDFQKKDSIWKIFVTINGGKQIKPVEVRKLDKYDAKIGYFYPFVTTWNSIYRLRFPKFFPADHQKASPDASDSVTLVVTSVLGSVEMVWHCN